MNKLVPLILGLALGSVQADFSVSAKANVITPDHRPAERCGVAITGSKEPPREAYWRRAFRGHFTESQLTSSYQPHVRSRTLSGVEAGCANASRLRVLTCCSCPKFASFWVAAEKNLTPRI